MTCAKKLPHATKNSTKVACRKAITSTHAPFLPFCATSLSFARRPPTRPPHCFVPRKRRAYSAQRPSPRQFCAALARLPAAPANAPPSPPSPAQHHLFTVTIPQLPRSYLTTHRSRGQQRKPGGNGLQCKSDRLLSVLSSRGRAGTSLADELPLLAKVKGFTNGPLRCARRRCETVWRLRPATPSHSRAALLHVPAQESQSAAHYVKIEASQI